MKAIVIGGVAAGMSAASKLRRVKPDAQIVVYERGGFLSYGACGLPYYVGGFNDDPAKLIARTQAVYKEMRIETHLFHEVTRVDPERKTVTVRNLDTGAVFEDAYDVLMVATGCNSVNPKIPGADSPAVFYLKTMEDGLLLHEILRLRDVTRVAVVGGGYIGLEFASMYASFGSKVTVLEGFAELIPREDRDIAAAVREALEKKGIEFRIGARVESVSDTAGGVRVAVADTQTGGKYEIDGDAVLLATGRRPATAGLNLEAAGIETDDRGAVRVGAHLRTTAPRVFAAGDVTGGLQFTYVSLDDFRIIRDVLLGDGARTTANRGPVPYSVFIEPTLSHVGMHEEEARKAGRDIRVNRIAVAAFPRSRILGSTEGVLKAVIDAKTDEILGCTLFGAESGEVINTVATAMKHGVTAHDLSNSIYTHPSMSESLNDLFA